LCKTNKLRAEQQKHRRQASERHRKRQYGMYEIAEAHGRHRSRHRQYCEDREQQDYPLVLVFPAFRRHTGMQMLLRAAIHD
jgi:hypothetical protein